MTQLEYLTEASRYVARKRREKEEKLIAGYALLGIGCFIVAVIINYLIT